MNGLKPWENARAWGKMKRLQAENARLKAEVERLTKAGDEVLSEWASGEEKDAKNFLKALCIWNAAKEGKGNE
jgi:hypothetical protein